MSVLVETGHLNEYPFNHARILYGNVATAVTATGAATNFPASAVLLDTTYERWKPSVSGDSITLTFPQQNINAIALSAHSDMVPTIEVRTAGGVFEEVVAYPFDGSTLESNFAEQEYALLDYSPDNQALLLLIKDRFADAVRITLTYSGTAPTLGNVRIGNVLEMQRPFYQGHQPAILSPDSVVDPNISESGEWLGASQTRQGFSLRFAWENLKAPWVRKNWVPFAQYLKTRPYVIAWNPKQFPADCFYASSSQVPKPNNSGPLNYQSISLSGRGYSDGTDAVVENLGPSTFDEQYTFTRSSGATETTISGTLREVADDVPRFEYDPVTGEALGLLIEEQRINLTQYPRLFTESVWTQLGAATITPYYAPAPNGTLTASLLDGLSSGSDGIEQTFTVSNSADYASTIYVKKATASGTVRLEYNDGTTSVFSSDLTLTDEWQRLEQLPTTTSTTYNLRVVTGGTGGASDCLIWHAQLEAGSFATSVVVPDTTFTSRADPATFYDSNGVLQTAAADVARDSAYGWFNGTLYLIGLLLEQASENLALYSEDLTQAAYTKTRSTITADAATAPDGAVTADKLVEDATAGNNHFFSQNITLSANTPVTLSLFVQAEERDQIELQFNNANAFDVDVAMGFDLGTEETYASSTVPTAPDRFELKKIGDNFFRCSITATTNGTGGAEDIFVLLNVLRDRVYTGDGTSGLYIWGVMIEEQPYATSYIPTAGTTVTRAADVSSSPAATREADDCVRALGSEFNPEAFTIYVNFESRSQGVSVAEDYFAIGPDDSAAEDRLLYVQKGSGADSMRLFYYNTSNNLSVQSLGGAVTNEKVAIAISGGNLTVSRNGSVVLTRTDFKSLISSDSLRLGGFDQSNQARGAKNIFHIILKPRAYTAAELEELTAP